MMSSPWLQKRVRKIYLNSSQLFWLLGWLNMCKCCWHAILSWTCLMRIWLRMIYDSRVHSSSYWTAGCTRAPIGQQGALELLSDSRVHSSSYRISCRLESICAGIYLAEDFTEKSYSRSFSIMNICEKYPSSLQYVNTCWAYVVIAVKAPVF